MSGAKHRRKGNRIEREIVQLHKDMGVDAERFPLSGASRYQGKGHDLDIYPFGREYAPMVAEVKGRKNGAGFATLDRWLGEYDLLFLRKDHCEPTVLMPWRTYQLLMDKTSAPRPPT